MGGFQGCFSKMQGFNYFGGVNVYFNINEVLVDSVEVVLLFYEVDGDLICIYLIKFKEWGEKLEFEKGGNIFNWNMCYFDGVDFDGMIMWWGGVGGFKVIFGEYEVCLSIGGEE